MCYVASTVAREVEKREMYEENLEFSLVNLEISDFSCWGSWCLAAGGSWEWLDEVGSLIISRSSSLWRLRRSSDIFVYDVEVNEHV